MLKINGVPLEKSFIFSGGEVQVRLPKVIPENNGIIVVSTVLNSSDAIMELILVNDALKFYDKEILKRLDVFYLPYARQDRVCWEGEAFSAKVMVELLNTLSFSVIRVMDVHSNKFVLPAKFKELKVLDIFKYHTSMMDGITAVVAPDKGASEKVRTIAEHFEVGLVIADKVRDPDTGFISGIEIISGQEYVTDLARLLVIDDICDGGMTFDILGDELTTIAPYMKTLELYVTHGIFSRGFTNLDFYDKIYTTNSICTAEHAKLNIIPT